MNIKALNKKLDEFFDKLIEDFRETSLNIHTLNVFTIVLIDFLLNLGPYISTIIYIGIFLGLMEAAKTFNFISILFPIFLVAYTGSNLVMILSILLILFLGLNKLMLNQIKERLYLLILAVFFQIGDGVTTFLGINKGLNEENIFLAKLFQLTGNKFILLPKIIILVLIIWVYEQGEEGSVYLKMIFLVGFYLTISNYHLL